eukprot:TCONS_00061651-protein
MFTVGHKFESFEELQQQLEHYSEETYTQYYLSDSKTCQRTKRFIKPELKYVNCKYNCVYGGRFTRRGSGVRNYVSLRETQCPAFIYIHATNEGDFLEVTRSALEHNHEISKEIYEQSRPRVLKRRSETIPEEYKAKIANLIKMKADRKELIKQVEEETGEKVRASDLANWVKREKEKGQKKREEWLQMTPQQRAEYLLKHTASNEDGSSSTEVTETIEALKNLSSQSEDTIDMQILATLNKSGSAVQLILNPEETRDLEFTEEETGTIIESEPAEVDYDTFKIGNKFRSFKLVQQLVRRLEEEIYTKFYVRDGRQSFRGEGRGNVDPTLQYAYVKFGCSHLAPHADGKTKTKLKRVKNCPVSISLTGKDGNFLEVVKTCFEHNHETSKEIYQSHPSHKRTKPTFEKRVFELFSIISDSEVVRKLLRAETGVDMSREKIDKIKSRAPKIGGEQSIYQNFDLPDGFTYVNQSAASSISKTPLKRPRQSEGASQGSSAAKTTKYLLVGDPATAPSKPFNPGARLEDLKYPLSQGEFQRRMLTLLQETRDATLQNACRCKCPSNQNESFTNQSDTLIDQSEILTNESESFINQSETSTISKSEGVVLETENQTQNDTTNIENSPPGVSESIQHINIQKLDSSESLSGDESLKQENLQNVELWSSGTETIEIVIEKQSEDENADSAQEIEDVIVNNEMEEENEEISKESFNEVVMTAIFKDAIEK